MAGPVDSKLVVIGWILLDFSPKPEGPLAPVQSRSCSNSLYNSIIQGQLWQTETAYSEAETLLCQQRSLESVMPSNHLILCCSLLLLSSVFPSIRVFTELVLHIRRPKYWSFNISISPCSEYSGESSFRMDWFDLLVVQGTLKSLLQHHSSKASVL